jgi:hypothetical protein
MPCRKASAAEALAQLFDLALEPLVFGIGLLLGVFGLLLGVFGLLCALSFDLQRFGDRRQPAANGRIE